MDDYSALAYRIAGGVADVRGCLILSRDGLILGSYPDDETAVKPAWVRFASLGDPERSFVEFGDQVWVYVRRPAYGAFAVANAGVRPGLVIDQLEGILTSAEESRNRRDTLRVPRHRVARRKPPTSSYKRRRTATVRPAGSGQRPGTALGPTARLAVDGKPRRPPRRRWPRLRLRRPLGDAAVRSRAGPADGRARRERCFRRTAPPSGGIDVRRMRRTRSAATPPTRTNVTERTSRLRWSSTPTPRSIRSCWPKSSRACFRSRAVMTKLVPDDLDRTDAVSPT